MRIAVTTLTIAAIAICVIAIPVINALRQVSARRKALAAVADEIGWSFCPSKAGPGEDHAPFTIFRKGRFCVARNTMVGSIRIAGRPCRARMGDFRCRLSDTADHDSKTYANNFSYLIVRLPTGDIPDIVIRPEGVLDRLTDAFGLDDIDFESAEFSRRFHVKSPDKRFAYALCHARMIEFLLDFGASIEIRDGRCCISDGVALWEPAWFKGRAASAQHFFELWPVPLRARLAGDKASGRSDAVDPGGIVKSRMGPPDPYTLS